MKREALCIALTATACGGVNSTDDMMIDPSDTVAPKIVSTTPTESEIGIGADTKIVVVFSEPMDPATVEPAYSSVQLPLDKVSTQWNADQTVLTISPDQSLLYGSGNGNNVNPADRLTYSISIGAGASDLVGNPLEADFVLSFSTKVRMATTAKLDSPLSCTTLGGSSMAENVNVIAGDTTSRIAATSRSICRLCPRTSRSRTPSSRRVRCRWKARPMPRSGRSRSITSRSRRWPV